MELGRRFPQFQVRSAQSEVESESPKSLELTSEQKGQLRLAIGKLSSRQRGYSLDRGVDVSTNCGGYRTNPRLIWGCIGQTVRGSATRVSRRALMDPHLKSRGGSNVRS